MKVLPAREAPPHPPPAAAVVEDRVTSRLVYQAIRKKDEIALRRALQQQRAKREGDDDDDVNDDHAPDAAAVVSFTSPFRWVLEENDDDEAASRMLRVLLEECGLCETPSLNVTSEPQQPSFSALHAACQRGFASCARVLLSSSSRDCSDVNRSHGKPPCTPLHATVRGWKTTAETGDLTTQSRQDEYAACLELLLEHGADPTRPDANGRDVWHAACAAGWARAVESLLSRHRRQQHTTNDRRRRLLLRRGTVTPLHAAAAAGRAPVITLLLRYHAPGDDGMSEKKKKNRKKNDNVVNLRDGQGNTPLHHAMTMNNSSSDDNGNAVETTALCLLQAGADPNARNLAGDSPLLLAVRNWQPHRLTLVKILLRAGAQVNVMEAPTRSPCHREKILVEALLRHGHAIARRGLIARRAVYETLQRARLSCWTPLHYAAFYGDVDLVRILLSHPPHSPHSHGGAVAAAAAVHVQDARGRTPLSVAGLRLAAAADRPPRLDMAVRLAGTDDPLPMDGEDLSVAHNFVRLGAARGRQDVHDDDGGVVPSLLAAGAMAAHLDADGNLPFAFACVAGADLTTIYQMVRAASRDGLYPQANSTFKRGHYYGSLLRLSSRNNNNNSVRRSTRNNNNNSSSSLRRTTSSDMRGLDAPTGCSIL